MTLQQMADGLGGLGDLQGQEERIVTHIEKDSRLVKPGDVFACIVGERFDGHNFVREAMRRGAAAVIVQRMVPELENTVPVLMVRDTVRALGSLAHTWRMQSSAQVAGITGTAGKTTLKEILGSILSGTGRTAKSYKNWNNQLGMSLSMLAAEGDEAFWVMEAGISIKGDMDELGTILRPDLAIIHNIGPAHLEGLGSLEGVAEEKSRFLASLQEGGTGLVSMDYPELFTRCRALAPEVVGFSTQDESARFFGRYLGRGEMGGRFMLRLDGYVFDLELPVWGEYMAENIVAAAAGAFLLKIPSEMIVKGLHAMHLPEQRFQSRSAGQWTLIDDTYNANPLSMRRAISAAADRSGKAPLVLVLGEMAELGEHSRQSHEELGEFIAASSCACVIFKGSFQEELLNGLKKRGRESIFHPVNSTSMGLRVLKDLGLEGGTVLFKGSRCCSMDDYFRAFLEELRS
ncbi:MAG: UDP-N-acetylmuramoyl-tripeptide--D-alanyl-D-alanine ligase [Desulfovibrionales bacterium]